MPVDPNSEAKVVENETTKNIVGNTNVSKKLNRILRLKQSSHVTVIQSRWRGRMARLVALVSKAENKVQPIETNINSKKLRRGGTTYKLIDKSFCATTKTKLNNIPLSEVTTAEFYVDSSVGLPFSSTATRVSVRLVSSDKSQVGDISPSSYGHPDSDYTSPAFDLRVGWKGLCPVESLTIKIYFDFNFRVISL